MPKNESPQKDSSVREDKTNSPQPIMREDQNQHHNIKKQAQGPNTKR